MLRLFLTSLLVLGASAVPAARSLVERQAGHTIKVSGSGIAAGTSVKVANINGINYLELVPSAEATTFTYDSTSQQLGAVDDSQADIFSQAFVFQGEVYEETPAPVSFKTPTEITDCGDLCNYEAWTLDAVSGALDISRSSVPPPKLYACDDGAQVLLWTGPTSWALCKVVTLSVE